MTEYEKWMNYAVSLAKRAWGHTSPNPLVGAVIIKDGQVIGRGWHKRAGDAHAEVNAIKSCRISPEGATIYVTLEPCSTTGRTPPCTEAIKRAGLKKVVIGTLDPNPSHAGTAVKILKESGIEVVYDICKAECDELNESFYKWITTGKPFVLLKMAMTLDGKIATKTGQSKWITGPVARQRVQRLRQWCDAIMVGGETVRKDSPSLTARDKQGNTIKYPKRIIASSSMTLEDVKDILPPGGSERVVSVKSNEDWQGLLTQLGSEQVTALLLEGGGELAAAALQAGVVDRVEFHIAPKILGGKNSRPVIAGIDPANLAEAIPLKNVRTGTLDPDIFISGDIIN